MPEISIIVPAFNVAEFLEKCLDSLLVQSLHDIEIICINDGSADKTAEILNAYQSKDSRIKVIHKDNSGYGHSMNVGLKTAAGNYIGIVEPDDFVANDMFEKLHHLAMKHDADVVKSDFFYYFTRENQVRTAGKISRSLADKVITAKEFPQILKIMPSIWSAIYRREFLEKHQIKFLETPGASYQDTSFAFKTLALADRIVFTPEAYLYYRQDNENSSVHSVKKVFHICREYDELTDFLSRHPEVKSYANAYKLIKQYRAYLWNVKRIDPEFRDQFIEVFADSFEKFHRNGELNGTFFSKVNKKEVHLLINDRKKFRMWCDKEAEKDKKTLNRKKKFSIRINTSRVSIILFGRQIAEIRLK